MYCAIFWCTLCVHCAYIFAHTTYMRWLRHIVDEITSAYYFLIFLHIIRENQYYSLSNLHRLAVQDKFSDRDVTLLTKQDVAITVKTQKLRHHIRNIADLAGRCFGENSVLIRNLWEMAKHSYYREVAYAYKFRQDKLLGGNILDRIHYRIHQFFNSCADGIPEKLDLDHLDFRDIMEQVRRREYVCKTPAWITKLVKRNDPNSRERDGNFSGPEMGRGY